MHKLSIYHFYCRVLRTCTTRFRVTVPYSYLLLIFSLALLVGGLYVVSMSNCAHGPSRNVCLALFFDDQVYFFLILSYCFNCLYLNARFWVVVVNTNFNPSDDLFISFFNVKSFNFL